MLIDLIAFYKLLSLVISFDFLNGLYLLVINSALYKKFGFEFEFENLDVISFNNISFNKKMNSSSNQKNWVYLSSIKKYQKIESDKNSHFNVCHLLKKLHTGITVYLLNNSKFSQQC